MESCLKAGRFFHFFPKEKISQPFIGWSILNIWLGVSAVLSFSRSVGATLLF
jgi:hypothetical protein